MPHNRLIIPVEFIPDSVKQMPAYNAGIFSSDGKYRQLDGYKIDPVTEEPIGDLVHPQGTLEYWCRNEPDPALAVKLIQDNSYIIKPSEYMVMRDNPDSIWYIEPVEV